MNPSCTTPDPNAAHNPDRHSGINSFARLSPARWATGGLNMWAGNCGIRNQSSMKNERFCIAESSMKNERFDAPIARLSGDCSAFHG